MRIIHFVLEHPFAAAGIIIAILYAWSTVFNKPQETPSWDARRLIRTFGPSALVILLALAVSTGLKNSFGRVDFGMFYSSALLLKQNPQHLYDPQIQTEYLHAVTGLEGAHHYLPFAYPPIVALLFIPLTVLSFKSAYFVMLTINIALLLFTLWWLMAKLKYQENQRLALLVSVTAALPIYAVLVLGHLTFLGLLLISLFATDLLENRPLRTGFWAGLLLFKPILFPVPLLILFWKKQWKAIGTFAMVSVGLLLVSFVLVGWSGLQSNLAMLRLMTSDYLLPRTQSLRGLAFSLGLGVIAWIALAVATLSALWIALLRARDQRWVLAAAMIAVMLIPPYLQFYDLSIGLIAIAIALVTMKDVSDKTRNYLFLIALVPGALVQAIGRNGPSIPIMPVVLATFFVYCLWRAFRCECQVLSREIGS